MKVIFYSTKPFERSFLEKANIEGLTVSFVSEALSKTSVHLAKGAEAISVFTNDDASAQVLDGLSALNVKYIATRAAGYDNIDLVRATELGIKVANVPAYSPYSIAEHTIAMILALNRKLIQADHRVKDYDFTLDSLIGFDLNAKSAGIIGAGKIGGIVANLLKSFGCKVYAFDPYPDIELQRSGVQFVGLDELCRLCDIISIHSPLNSHTKHLINSERIGMMKDGVMIINTGRGGIIKTEDLLPHLKSGKIGYLGLDVYEFEKGLFFFDHSQDIPSDDLFARLTTFKNVLITGHQAFLTENALENIADTTFFNLNCWSKNKSSENEVNK